MYDCVQYVCMMTYHLSEYPSSLHKHEYWKNQNFKIIHKMTYATRKNMQIFIWPVLEEGRFKSIKLYTILLMGSSKIFQWFVCHVSLFTEQ